MCIINHLDSIGNSGCSLTIIVILGQVSATNGFAGLTSKTYSEGSNPALINLSEVIGFESLKSKLTVCVSPLIFNKTTSGFEVVISIKLVGTSISKSKSTGCW